MTKSQYLTDNRRDESISYFRNVFTKAFEEAKEERRNEKDYLKLMEDYLSTLSYSKFLNSINPKGLHATLCAMVENTDDEQKVEEIIQYSPEVFYFFNIPWIKAEDITIDNYVDKLEVIIEGAINNRVIEDQKEYADSKLSIKEYLSSEDWNKFNAIVANMENGTIEEMTSRLLIALEVENMIIEK